MHQPYTALTLNSTRPATSLHTFPRQSSHHKPIHQRHSPTDTRANTATQNQSTNDHRHTPIHAHHRYRAHTAPQTRNSHRHTAPQTPTRRRTGPVDVVDALTLTQHRRCRGPASVGNWTGQADRLCLDESHARTGHAPAIRQARHQTGRVQNQTRPGHWLRLRRDQQAGFRKFFCET